MEFSDFGALIRAIWSNWVGLMSGIIGLALTAYAVLRRKETSRRGFLTAGFICVVIALTAAWADERRARKDLSPGLIGRIDDMLIAIGSDDSRPKDTGEMSTAEMEVSGEVVVRIVVSNSGTPSVADDWGLKITSARYGDRTIRPTEIPRSGIMFMGGPRIPYDDILSERTISPIPNGGRLKGWLWFRLKTHSEVFAFQDLNGKAEFIFRDVHEKQHLIVLDKGRVRTKEAEFKLWAPPLPY